MATQFTIEKGIPVPPRLGGARPAKYPFRDMSPGDSFRVTLSDSNCKTLGKLQNSISSCARAAWGKGNGTVRKIDNGTAVRVWRLS